MTIAEQPTDASPHEREPGAPSRFDKQRNNNQMLPGMSSVRALVQAKTDDAAVEVRVYHDFERVNHGRISNSYLTHDAGVVLLVKQSDSLLRRRLLGDKNEAAGGHDRELLVWPGDNTAAVESNSFIEAIWCTLWMARCTERASDSMMSRYSRQVAADMLFAVAVFLLKHLEIVKPDKMEQYEANRQLDLAASQAKEELKRIDDYIKQAKIRTSYRQYLLGLPVGLTIALALPAVLHRLSDLEPTVQTLVTITILAGGIGAIASVMARITRGQKVSVDVDQGRIVTATAGAFRPLIGAVFGVAIYVFVIAGLIPLGPRTTDTYFFFAGLAFLAGFSERWAQDTIIRSAPIAPSPATPRSPGHLWKREDPPPQT
jgi:hypothetical protein